METVYELAAPLEEPMGEPKLCRFCGTDIVAIEGRWYALEARWPNLAHCHYEVGTGQSMAHCPKDEA